MVRIKDEIMSYKYSGNLQAEKRKRRYHYSALGIGLETFQHLCYSFSQRYEKDHKKHHGYFVQHHSFAQKLFKALTKKGAVDLPFLMSYSGNAFDLFAEESSVLMKCLKNSVQYQPSPADEANEAKAARHSQMDTEVKAAQLTSLNKSRRCVGTC